MDAKPGEELESSVLPAYALVHSILYSGYDRRIARYTKTQIAVLAILYWQKEMFMSQLADALSVPRAQMTRAVTPLADDGMIERFEDKSNRKKVHVRLTDAGRDHIRDYMHSRFHVLREHLTEEEAARLLEAAETIVDILRTLRDRS